MEKTLFRVIDICRTNNIEQAFIQELHSNGLIEIIVQEEQEYLEEEQVLHVERYSTWHYELELNVQGIEVVHNLIEKIEDLQRELRYLRADKDI
ncbi:chaperone modulator CbpM [Sphingobacterium lactis]|uniref:MerR HTH family regulatory protein n=1 Tax=Sphingobacterium lactis TaxID=797291 RepID=A0A1H5RQJ7_9SPHI|nr:chaperone modulator CbpM [Sphingobacterium lactis]SEF40626.1 MerR HTH family regulatory protein [Sphingobacterium lactis]